jgi:hypothetical protein
VGHPTRDPKIRRNQSAYESLVSATLTFCYVGFDASIYLSAQHPEQKDGASDFPDGAYASTHQPIGNHTAIWTRVADQNNALSQKRKTYRLASVMFRSRNITSSKEKGIRASAVM